MAAPKNNEFWKLRASHGRKQIFKTAEDLKKAAAEYFEATDKRRLNGMKPPYTLQGLCIFLGVNTSYLSQFKKDCNEDFSIVIKEIEDVIYMQKFEGSTVGLYNSNIIARDLGLVDKQQSSVNMKVKGLEGLTDEELEEKIKNAEQGAKD